MSNRTEDVEADGKLLAESRVGQGLQQIADGLRDQWRAARTRHLLARAGRAVGRGSRTATVTALGAQVADWTRASFCYRWLTREPDPDVIVIDLRETYAVGPVIAALDRLLGVLVPAGARSRIGTAAAELQRRGRQAPVRVASLLVLAAVAGSVAATALTGGLSRGGALGSLVVALLTLLGTQVTMSWDDLCDTRLADWLRAVFEPPPPED